MEKRIFYQVKYPLKDLLWSENGKFLKAICNVWTQDRHGAWQHDCQVPCFNEAAITSAEVFPSLQQRSIWCSDADRDTAGSTRHSSQHKYIICNLVLKIPITHWVFIPPFSMLRIFRRSGWCLRKWLICKFYVWRSLIIPGCIDAVHRWC